MTAGCSSPPCWRGSARARGCPVVKPKNKHSLSHVRHDPALSGPGLFRALKRGERKQAGRDDYGDGKRIEFSGPEPLGADDLRILQGLVAMAGPNGLCLARNPRPKADGSSGCSRNSGSRHR
ncbi:replication protein C, IncQ-type [Escherichia coli]|uniref:replication protein C, IncQ-type n=1 Tax=Escherichia coli TaxID=562 RepID=UPI003D9CB2C2